MIKWLQNYSGNGIHGENIERDELLNLRKELKHYKKKYEKEEKEILIVSDNEEKESQEEQEKIDEELKKKHQKNKQVRPTISDEVIADVKDFDIKNLNNQEEEMSPEIFEKIKSKIQSIFLFNRLSDNELNLIINSFITETKNEGEVIFTQGDSADKFYILESGELDCWKTFKKGDPETYIKTYREGDSFGELALLYDYTRNYTIRANTNVLLFSLERKKYKGIIQGLEMSQREKYKNALKKIDIFQNLTPNEFAKICDIMVEQKFSAGEEIIKSNENEDEFVILYEGKCHSEKARDSGKPPEVLKEFDEFDYFGEAPWFKYEQRNYSVIADSDCTVFVISRKEFKRLVGFLENLLKRKNDTYQKFMKK